MLCLSLQGEGRGLIAARLWMAATTRGIRANNGQQRTAGTPALSTLWQMTSSTVLWMSDSANWISDSLMWHMNNTEVVELQAAEASLLHPSIILILYCPTMCYSLLSFPYPFPFSHRYAIHQQSAEAGWSLKNRLNPKKRVFLWRPVASRGKNMILLNVPLSLSDHRLVYFFFQQATAA